MRRFIFVWIMLAAFTGACGVGDIEDAPESSESESTDFSAVTCSPRMSVFPVAEPHNIGYDAASCRTGTCRVSCPDQNANSDWGGRHHGIDVFARRGAPLVAVAAGTIVAVSTPSNTSGLRVRLRDACGWEYYYGHLDEAVVSRNQQVQAGQLIGYMGNTGTSGVHLHFNISPDGNYSSDINPFPLLRSTSPTACSATPPPDPEPDPQPMPATPSSPPTQCAVMLPNQYLTRGTSLSTCNAAYSLHHQSDGNVVLINNSSGAPVWSSGTSGHATSTLSMQSDGNLVLYSTSSVALWHTGTHGNAGAALVMHDSGNLVVYGAAWRVLWMTDTDYAGTRGCGGLGSGAGLSRGQSVFSCGGRYQLAHQGDGNVVLYSQRRSRAIWSSGTPGRSTSVFAMQGDGNLVLYAPDNRALWASGTSGRFGATLGVQDDGNMVIYSGNRAVWSTNTAGQ